MAPGVVGINAQSIINCQIGGDCNGGWPGPVYEYAHTHGLADSSCEQYVSLDLAGNKTCTEFDICRDCVPPSPAANDSGL
jgi:cathepsin X